MRGMSKRILDFRGHPDAGNRHFGHALADAYVQGARDGWCCSCRSETTYCDWRLYMAGCALEFEAGGTGIYQIRASKRNRRESGRFRCRVAISTPAATAVSEA